MGWALRETFFAEINEYNSAENTSTIIFTVAADKPLALCAVTFHAHNIGAAAGTATLHVRNVADVIQYNIYCACCLQNQSVLDSLTYPAPNKILPGWDIVISSDSANLNACGYINGYEIWEQFT